MNKYVLGALIALAVVVYVVRVAVPRFIGDMFQKAIENGGQWTEMTVDCPKCGGTLWTNFGGEMSCPVCGTRLTGCGCCGQPLLENQRFRTPDSRQWLCAEHFQELLKLRAHRKELDEPEAQIRPERKGWTETVQQLYEARFRQADEKGLEDDQLFSKEQTLNFFQNPGQRDAVPAAVREAFDFYHFCMRERGILDVYRVSVEGRESYLVTAEYSGGSDKWVEVYDAEGQPHGFGRTDTGVTLWNTKAAVRKRVFGDKLEPELLAARKRGHERRNPTDKGAVDR
jgi:hypothetical protein